MGVATGQVTYKRGIVSSASLLLSDDLRGGGVPNMQDGDTGVSAEDSVEPDDLPAGKTCLIQLNMCFLSNSLQEAG